jgi:hypothetical protein
MNLPERLRRTAVLAFKPCEVMQEAADRIEALEAVAIAAKALVSRDDFWSNNFATPGEFDDVVDALAALGIER